MNMSENWSYTPLLHQFRSLIEHKCIFDRYVAAGSPDTPRDILAQLGFDVSSAVRKHVAENPNTPLAALSRLAADYDWEVRLGVAENTATPVALLELLAQDDNVDVRFGLAESVSTPLHILRTLARDENPYVVWRANRTLKMLRPPDDPFAACA